MNSEIDFLSDGSLQIADPHAIDMSGVQDRGRGSFDVADVDVGWRVPGGRGGPAVAQSPRRRAESRLAVPTDGFGFQDDGSFNPGHMHRDDIVPHDSTNPSCCGGCGMGWGCANNAGSQHSTICYKNSGYMNMRLHGVIQDTGATMRRIGRQTGEGDHDIKFCTKFESDGVCEVNTAGSSTLHVSCYGACSDNVKRCEGTAREEGDEIICSCECKYGELYEEYLRQFHRIVCGPDITNWLAKTIAHDFSHLASTGVFGPFMPAAATGIGLRWCPGGPRDLKNMKVESDRCPRRCSWGLTLCGKCVGKDVPGNIGFGAVLGIANAAMVGAAQQIPVMVYGGGGEDRADHVSYRVGDDASRYTDRTSGEIRKSICRSIDAIGEAGAEDGFFQDCEPCGDKWDGQ